MDTPGRTTVRLREPGSPTEAKLWKGMREGVGEEGRRRREQECHAGNAHIEEQAYGQT